MSCPVRRASLTPASCSTARRPFAVLARTPEVAYVFADLLLPEQHDEAPGDGTYYKGVDRPHG